MQYLSLLLLLTPLALSIPLAQGPTDEVTLKTSVDGTCGPEAKLTCLDSVFGNCCSSYGHCGSSATHCAEGCQLGFGKCTSEEVAKITPDGTCGPASKGSYICPPHGTEGAKKWGSCCSGNGFCGSTGSYCGADCQDIFSSVGACIKENIPSVDGRCGPQFGGFNCEGGAYHGTCCSQWGYCGLEERYCSKKLGCQEEFGAPCIE